MTTPISDQNAFYGKYISKKNRAVPLQIARYFERECYEASTKYRIAQGDIDRAHIELDHLGIPRNQENTAFPLSLAGRIRYLTKYYTVTPQQTRITQEKKGDSNGKRNEN